jgi:hypothetical protein
MMRRLAALACLSLAACADPNPTGLEGDFELALDDAALASAGLDTIALAAIDQYVPATCSGLTEWVPSEGFVRITWTCHHPERPQTSSPNQPWQGVLLPNGDGTYTGTVFVEVGTTGDLDSLVAVPATLTPED